MATRIFIVGDQAMAARLPQSPGKKALVRIAGHCASGEEAVRRLRNRRVDVVLVHFDLLCMDGFECVRKLRKMLPDIPILMFMLQERRNDDDLVFSALHAGAQGYLPGQLPPAELAWAIFQAHRAAEQHSPVFMMLYQSDRHLSRSARYWHKVTAMLNASTVNLDYGKTWRRVIVRAGDGNEPAEPLVPSLVVNDPGLVAA